MLRREEEEKIWKKEEHGEDEEENKESKTRSTERGEKLSKNCFTKRVTDASNRLNSHVVSFKALDSFKRRLEGGE